MLDKLVICYLNNVLFFCPDLETHQVHVQHVVKRLWMVDLYPEANECECHTDKVDFLGFAVVPNGRHNHGQEEKSPHRFGLAHTLRSAPMVSGLKSWQTSTLLAKIGQRYKLPSLTCSLDATVIIRTMTPCRTPMSILSGTGS